MLQGAGRERQTAGRFANAQINPARRNGGQYVKIFGDFIGAVMLQHDAA